MRRLFLALLILSGSACAANPVVQYTDLDSGPRSGNSDTTYCTGGAYLGIFGKNFGVVQGGSTVTLGGTAVACVVSWSDTKIFVVVAATTPLAADAVVVTVGGNASNSDVTFTARSSGTIYYGVSTGTANTSCVSGNTGTFSSPWRINDVVNTKNLTYFQGNCLSPGDILYLENGVIQDYSDAAGFKQPYKPTRGGTAGLPIAVGTYPGATATLSTFAGESYIWRFGTCSTNACAYNTMFGMTLINNSTSGIGGVAFGSAASPISNFRFVNNTITCPYCTASAAALEPKGNNQVVLGNEIYNVSTSLASTSVDHTWHTTYFAGNGLIFAYNNLHDNNSCNGLQVHDDTQVQSPAGTGGGGYYDIHIHDNIIKDQLCFAINLSTIDFPTGSEVIEVYNNVIGHVGFAQFKSESANSSHGGIALKDQGRVNASGTVDVFNNSIYDAGGVLNSTASNAVAIINKGNSTYHQSSVKIQLRNNVFQEKTYSLQAGLNTYCNTASFCTVADVIGSNNVWYGGTGAIPAGLTSNTTTDPLFTNVSISDFTLQATSPAKNGGVTIAALLYDISGNSRPQNTTYSLGAYEIPATGVVASFKSFLSHVLLRRGKIH